MFYLKKNHVKNEDKDKIREIILFLIFITTNTNKMIKFSSLSSLLVSKNALILKFFVNIPYFLINKHLIIK